MKTLKLAGRQISRLRYEREWTPEDLADRLYRAGWLNSWPVSKPKEGERMETIPESEEPPATTERLAYSIEEAAAMLGVHYFSIYRLIQRGKLKACRALRGKLLVPRAELLKLLKTE